MTDPALPALAATLVASHGLPAGPVRPLGSGLDHSAYLVGEVVVRLAAEPDPGEVEREASLLAVVARFVPLPVPRPLFTVPELGCLAYRRLPGVPLLDRPADHRPPGLAGAVGAVLGRFHAALRAIPAEELAGLAAVDGDPPAAWLAEATGTYPTVADRLPAPVRAAVESFLGTPPPPGPAAPAFCHGDLGIEHVLTGRTDGTGSTDVTGVIDWSDAAFTDPAQDLGRLLRDLGPAALDAALAAGPGGDPDVRDRAWWFARCGLLEDLAHGLATGRDAYVRKSLDGVAWLFPASPGPSGSGRTAEVWTIRAPARPAR